MTQSNEMDTLGQHYLFHIASIKERIDYLILFSIVIAIALGSFSIVSVWLVLVYLSLVALYQYRWSNEAIIKKHENRDSTYEFNEVNFRQSLEHSDEVDQDIAYDAAQILLTEFGAAEIKRRSGEQFYQELLDTVALDEEENKDENTKTDKNTITDKKTTTTATHSTTIAAIIAATDSNNPAVADFVSTTKENVTENENSVDYARRELRCRSV